jgi:hypothetical protein
MSALKRINNEINRKFPKNIKDLFIPYKISFINNSDFTNNDNIQLTIDIYNKYLFTISIRNTYPFYPPNIWINTNYGTKNYNKWCADTTTMINKQHFLSSINILLATFFSIDMNTSLYKNLKNIPIKFPLSCLCCESITCPHKWHPGFQIKHIIEEYMFNKKFLFFTSPIGIKLIMPIFYNDKWNIPEDILLHIFMYII